MLSTEGFSGDRRAVAGLGGGGGAGRVTEYFIDGGLQYNYNLIMGGIRFEWDETKNQSNIRKHQVSFGEAKSVFYDPNALLIHDPDNSEAEDRFVMLGMTEQLRLLIVCHCYREDDEVIRLISARKANTAEKMQYGG